MEQARYIMIGGFLGAGKTTAVAKLAQRLAKQGKRVGLITNDQGSGLVDTATLRARGFATEEIPGGCFCCRFNSLVEAARRLTDASRPEVFIAEPVGSCTDLMATVSYPLRRIYGREFSIAPLTVLVDPIRAERVLGLEAGARFSEKVHYIYRKQLEEADAIAINKCELLNASRQARLEKTLSEAFPGQRMFPISARTGAGLEEWFEFLLSEAPENKAAMQVDYAIYGEGEALLGWLNATVRLESGRVFDANIVLERAARFLQERLAERGAEIAHLKMTLSPEGGLNEIAGVNLVRNDFVPELGLKLEEPVGAGELIINLRAEAPPELLDEAVKAALQRLESSEPELRCQIRHVEFFRPGQPNPTHRLANP